VSQDGEKCKAARKKRQIQSHTQLRPRKIDIVKEILGENRKWLQEEYSKPSSKVVKNYISESAIVKKQESANSLPYNYVVNFNVAYVA